MKKKYGMAFFLILLIATSLFSGCKAETEMVTESTYMLGTHLQVSIWTENKTAGRAIIQEAFDRINEIEQKMSVNIEESEISELNEKSGKEFVKISDDTALVLKTALQYAQLSKGAFDPTIGRLVKLWGIGTEHERVPDPEETEEALKYVNYELLEQKEQNTFKLAVEGMSVDLGGIAKGYAADEVYSILKTKGIKHAIINLGGNVLTLGNKTDGTDWRVGIQNPFEPTGTHMGIVQLSDKTVVTSGNYERYFFQDNKRYHHIIDPKTGYPSENGIISASIITDRSMNADALSTTVYILGVEKGLALIESLDGVETMIITQDKNVYLSSGLKGKIEIIDDEFVLAN